MQSAATHHSLHDELEAAARRADSGRLGLWGWLRAVLDFAAYSPEQAPGTIMSRLEEPGGSYYVLKNPKTHTYYRLSERDHYLWGLMDGSHTVKELVIAYFMEYGTFAFSRVATLVSALRANNLLADQPIDVYSSVRSELARRDPRSRASQLWHGFLQTPIAISGIDGFFDLVYRHGGWLLFTRPAQVLYVILTLAGLYLFGRLFASATYPVVAAEGSLGLGFVLLLVAQFLSILLHELAHGLAVKHYGREVRKAGMLLYFGMPAFFVDTTDIWLEPRRARLVVTWAGPYSGLVLSSLACVAIAIWPDAGVNALLFKFAFMSYLLVFVNLNPLLELDGYYLLMDWLRIPMLRRKSMAFVTEGLPAKWKAARAAGFGLRGRVIATITLSREEKIFAVFGVLALAWTSYAIYAGIVFWQGRLAGNISALWAGGATGGKVFLGVLGVAVSLVFVAAAAIIPYRLLRSVMRGLNRLGAFGTTGRVAAMCAIAVLGACTAVVLAQRNDLWMPIAIVALAAAVLLAVLNARNYAGSHMTLFFGLFAASMAAFIGSSLVSVLSIAGQVLLVASAVLIVSQSELRALQRTEKAGLGVGLAASAVMTAWAVRAPPTEDIFTLSSRLGPLVTLILLAPTIASFWSTLSGPAWVLLGSGLLALLVLPLARAPVAPAFMLFAAGLGVHHLAFARLMKRPIPAGDQREADDREYLRDVFRRFVTSISEQLRQTAGTREAGAKIARFNDMATRAGWRVRIALATGSTGLHVEDQVRPGENLIEQGRRYAAALNLLVDVVAAETGEKLAVRSLQDAYDRLPWEERELAAHYLLPDVRRAGVLSQRFESLRSNYRSLLRRIPLFATMTSPDLDLLASRLRSEQAPAGRVIIRQGNRGDKFFIVNEGHVEVTVRADNGVTEVVRQIGRGEYFGEVALLRDSPRNATCRATVPSELLSLSREDFNALVRDRFALRERVDQAMQRVELLRSVPLFNDMDAAQLQEIAAALHEQTFEAGEPLIRQGDVGETFFVIESGRVQVSVLESGIERVVAERGPGEYVGEIALLMKVPRTATVKAMTTTRTQVLHHDDFDRLVAQQMLSAQSLQQEATRRYSQVQRIKGTTGPTDAGSMTEGE